MGELLIRPVGGAAPVSLVVAGVVWMHCTRVGCYWRRVGGTLGRWGLRAVGTTLGQWIPPLVEQAYSRRDSKRTRRPTMTTGTLCRLRARERCRRTREGGAGLYRTNHGLSLLRGPVSTVLTLTGPASMFPAGIVGILRFFFGVRRRQHRGHPHPVMPRPSATLASWTTRLPRVSARASVSEVMTPTCLRSEETAQLLRLTAQRRQRRQL